jgi:hypothetical protein
MKTVNLEPALVGTASKPQSVLLTQKPLTREENHYAPSVVFSSKTNKVELPLQRGEEEYDDLIDYETTRKYPTQTASKWTRDRITLLVIIFSLIMVIGFLGASLFHTIRTHENCKLYLFFKVLRLNFNINKLNAWKINHLSFSNENNNHSDNDSNNNYNNKNYPGFHCMR